MLIVQNLSKSFFQGNRELRVLENVSFELEQGAVCAIVGPSGSGKSTLLGLCAGLDRPSAGTVELDGFDLARSDEDELTAFRGEKIGFIFQSFQLIPTLTALENVMVPAELRDSRTARADAVALLNQVGLAERLGHYPAQLSGGEQQRVALARAYINRPLLLLGDEPTGSLDNDSAKSVEELLFALNREHRTTLVLATHNLELAAHADSVISLHAGHVTSVQKRKGGS